MKKLFLFLITFIFINNLLSNNGPLCEGDTLELYADHIDGATYYWYGPDGFTSNEQNPIIPGVTLDNAGEYYLYITVGGEDSPPVSTTVIIHPNPPISVNDVEICEGDNAILTATGGTSYIWNTGAPSNPLIVSPSSTTTYIVTGTDNNGCSNIDSATVEIIHFISFYAPNAFVPKIEGPNNHFIPVGRNINEFELFIFDRWGKMVYTTTSIDKPWDGRIDGDYSTTTQSYVWMAYVRFANGDKKIFNGNVLLIR